MRAASNHHISIPLTRGASGHTAGKRSAAPRFFYRHRCPNGCVAFVAVLLFLLAALLSAAPSGAAGLVNLTDAELANVTGQAGVTIFTSGSARITIDVLKFSDTDSSPLHWLELRNVVVDDGKGGYFSFDTPFYLSDPFDPANPFVFEPVTFDVGTKNAWTETTTTLIADMNGKLPGDPDYIPTYQTIYHPAQALVAVQDSTHVSPRWYSVGDLVFCDQSLGSLNLDALSLGPSLQRYGAHADGTSGVDFDYSTSVYAQALRYTYNSKTLPETLTLTGIHLVGWADVLGKNGTGDNPADPNTWAFTGANNVFRIGNIDTGNPATIDVGTTDAGITSLVLNLPFQGTLRVENVTFGGNNFGPIAIDGINVHHLNVKISGGS